MVPGDAAPRVLVQREDFNMEEETQRIAHGRGDIGAVVTFTGLCRDEGGSLNALELEHYPGMAESELERISNLAVSKFELSAITVIHRYGKLKPGEQIVLVIAASPHRQAAFDGANFIMDFLKTSAPFWKKEHPADGRQGEWVSAKDADDRALNKWSEKN